jgi:hypothetical protein
LIYLHSFYAYSITLLVASFGAMSATNGGSGRKRQIAREYMPQRFDGHVDRAAKAAQPAGVAVPTTPPAGQ